MGHGKSYGGIGATTSGGRHVVRPRCPGHATRRVAGLVDVGEWMPWASTVAARAISGARKWHSGARKWGFLAIKVRNPLIFSLFLLLLQPKVQRRGGGFRGTGFGVPRACRMSRGARARCSKEPEGRTCVRWTARRCQGRFRLLFCGIFWHSFGIFPLEFWI